MSAQRGVVIATGGSALRGSVVMNQGLKVEPNKQCQEE